MQYDRWKCVNLNLPEGQWTELRVPVLMKYGCNQIIVEVDSETLIGDDSGSCPLLPSVRPSGPVWQEIIGALTVTDDRLGRFPSGCVITCLKPLSGPAVATVKFTR